MLEEIYKLTWEEFSEISIMAARVKAMGDFFEWLGPEILAGRDEEGYVKDFYIRCGDVLTDAGSKIDNIMSTLDEKHIEELKQQREKPESKEDLEAKADDIERSAKLLLNQVEKIRAEARGEEETPTDSESQ